MPKQQHYLDRSPHDGHDTVRITTPAGVVIELVVLGVAGDEVSLGVACPADAGVVVDLVTPLFADPVAALTPGVN